MATATQARRVLASLTAAGARGVTQADWLRWPTPDGGPPITRLAARVNELRDLGYRIESRGRRDKCALYVYLGRVTLDELRAELAAEQLEQLEPTPLFDAPAIAASTSHYDVEKVA